jgi:peptidoglycan hydrolase-like protein with peptidoglycan-binding domain
MPLTSPRFAGNDRLERCAAGDFDARLTLNTVGDFVALVQQALMDLGESLPQFGADGGYGQETTAAVLNYKTRHDLRSPDGSIDGIVGPLTMTKLDEECTALDETAEPCPPDADAPVVDLAGQDDQLVNWLLANTLAGRVVGVDSDGGTYLLTQGVDGAGDLAGQVAQAAADLLVADRPDAVTSLLGGLAGLADAYSSAGDADTAQAFASSAVWVPPVDIGPQLAEFIIQQLALLNAGGGTPIRDLSKASALNEALLHVSFGRITLDPPAVTQADGSVQLPDPKAKFAIPTTIAGVTFKFSNFGDKTRPNYQPFVKPLAGLDIRHVVGIARMAMHLNTTWGVTEIHHVGMGNEPGRTDCHGQGRATDFLGAKGNRNGADFFLTVFNDWKLFSVPNLRNPAKPRLPEWPAVSGPIEYRLATHPTVDPFVRDFWADVYAWATSEYQDRSDGPGQIDPPSAIGRASRVMTPDHPTSDPLPSPHGREAHHSHMHWQVGPTGSQAL